MTRPLHTLGRSAASSLYTLLLSPRDEISGHHFHCAATATTGFSIQGIECSATIFKYLKIRIQSLFLLSGSVVGQLKNDSARIAQWRVVFIFLFRTGGGGGGGRQINYKK